MSQEDEKKAGYLREEIIEMVKQIDLRRLKLIYQYIKALMA